MKNCKKAALTLAIAATFAMLMAGCRDSNDNSSSIPQDSSASAPEPSSKAPDRPDKPESGYGNAPRDNLPESNPSSTAALGNDFEEFDALPEKAMDWGPGGPVDEKNRSQSALSYNEKYGKYNASFIGPDEKTVYMTFDEGYEYGLTGNILDTLKEKQVKGVFFITYDFANRSGDIVQRMIDEGHVVGNHSYSHKNYSTLTAKQMADDIMKMHDFVKEKFNYEMTYFRFPSGNFNEKSLAVVQKMGYRTLFWSFAYKDWIVDQQPAPAPSADKVVKAVCPGNIYLLHAVSSTNNEILGEVIDRVRADGFEWGDPSKL